MYVSLKPLCYTQVLEGEETQEAPEGDTQDAEQGPRPSSGPRMTTKYLTKYEKARVLGTRALQIRQACAHLTLYLMHQDCVNIIDFETPEKCQKALGVLLACCVCVDDWQRSSDACSIKFSSLHEYSLCSLAQLLAWQQRSLQTLHCL